MINSFPHMYQDQNLFFDCDRGKLSTTPKLYFLALMLEMIHLIKD